MTFSSYCNLTHDSDLSPQSERLQGRISAVLPHLFQETVLCAGLSQGKTQMKHFLKKTSSSGYQIPGYGSCFGDSGSPVVRFFTNEPYIRYTTRSCFSKDINHKTSISDMSRLLWFTAALGRAATPTSPVSTSAWTRQRSSTLSMTSSAIENQAVRQKVEV